MKKLPLLSLITALSSSTFAHAGSMGPIEPVAPCLSSFLALEGGYTWNQLDGYNYSLTGFNASIYSRESNNGFTGRLSAGMLRSGIDELFSLSGEIGYGYYGRTTYNPRVNGFSLPGFLQTRHTLSGLDALVGIAYTADPNYSVYFKAGALVQNMTSKINANLSTLNLPIATYHNSSNNTAVLPELKVGAAYNFLPNWALTASYLHAFGSSPRTSGNFNIANSSASLYNNTQNPSMDVALLGIQYSM